MISKKTDFLPFTEETVMNPKITEIKKKIIGCKFWERKSSNTDRGALKKRAGIKYVCLCVYARGVH